MPQKNGRPNRGAVSAGPMQYRTLGGTGVKVSLAGLGGFHIGNPKLSGKQAIRIIQCALDHGLNFMDNSWDYNEGESEKRLGKALQGGYRERAFVMTKLDGRSREDAERQLHQSLKRLKVETIDLLQHHEVIRFDDADRIFAKGGAMEAFTAAKKAGKIRFIGFTGHKDPQVHLHMLKVADEHDFAFDTVQMPLNLMDTHYRSFEQNVLPELVRRGIGVLGMKSMGDGVILKSKTVTAVECLHFAMNLPTSVVITGIDSMKILEQALRVAAEFRPLSKAKLAALKAKTARAAAQGEFELFKTSSLFDQTALHPEWLGDESARAVRLRGA
jgi:predicted aldo/keto reductase-like oxidoreductase